MKTNIILVTAFLMLCLWISLPDIKIGLAQGGLSPDRLHWQTYKTKNFSLIYPSEFELVTNNLETLGQEFRLNYKTPEGDFEFSVEKEGAGFDSSNISTTEIKINGREFVRGEVMDNENRILFEYIRPSSPSATFNHLQGTFPARNSLSYRNIFNRLMYSLKI